MPRARSSASGPSNSIYTKVNVSGTHLVKTPRSRNRIQARYYLLLLVILLHHSAALEAGGRGRGIPPGALADLKGRHGAEDPGQRQRARATDEAALEPHTPRSPRPPTTLHARRADGDPGGAPGAVRKDPGSFLGSRAPRRGVGAAGFDMMQRVGGEGTGAGSGGSAGHPAEAFSEQWDVGFEPSARLSPPGTYGTQEGWEASGREVTAGYSIPGQAGPDLRQAPPGIMGHAETSGGLEIRRGGAKEGAPGDSMGGSRRTASLFRQAGGGGVFFVFFVLLWRSLSNYESVTMQTGALKTVLLAPSMALFVGNLVCMCLALVQSATVRQKARMKTMLGIDAAAEAVLLLYNLMRVLSAKTLDREDFLGRVLANAWFLSICLTFSKARWVADESW